MNNLLKIKEKNIFPKNKEIKNISKEIVLIDTEIEKINTSIKDLNSKVSISNMINNMSYTFIKTSLYYVVGYWYVVLTKDSFEIFILNYKKQDLATNEELGNNLIHGVNFGLFFSLPINIYNIYDIIHKNILIRKEIKELEDNKENFKNQKHELENRKKILIIEKEQFNNKNKKIISEEKIEKFDLYFQCNLEEQKLQNERRKVLLQKHRNNSL